MAKTKSKIIESDLFNIVMIGMMGQGKTSLIKSIVYECFVKKSYRYMLVFSSTGLQSNNYDYLDNRFVHQEFDPDILKRFAKQHKKRNKDAKKLKIKSLVVLDDIICDDELQKRSVRSLIFGLITQYRHLGLSFIITSQTMRLLPIKYFSLSTHFIIFRNTVVKQIKEKIAQILCMDIVPGGSLREAEKETIKIISHLAQYEFFMITQAESKHTKKFRKIKCNLPKKFKLKF